MRGKKAKELRRIIKGVYEELPDVLYTKTRIVKRYTINTVAGPTTVALPIIIHALGECKRGKYQRMKKLYKDGVFAHGY